MNQETALSLIKVDPDLQMRAGGTDAGVASEYAEAMLEGAVFPPVLLFFDGTDYWPADGFHRIEAARRANRETILADVREGGKREAKLAAAGANNNHGLRRTNEDKRRAVAELLRDPEWSVWSDRKIAEIAKVSHPLVAKVKAELTGKISTTSPMPASQAAPSGNITKPEPPAEESSPSGGSMVEMLITTASTDLLIAECRRRGLEVIQNAA